MLNCHFQYQQQDFLLSVQLEMQHQLLGIVGPSGCGKSTFLKNIVGLCNPSHGSIQLNQQIIFDSKQSVCLPTYQRNIALIFQQALLFPHLNVMQNLKYAHRWSGKKHNTIEWDQVVQLLELSALLKRKAHQLSGGEAQRVSIGRALLSSPQLLLLDEPLTGLDQRLRQQILAFLKNVKDETGLPIIYVTHHIEELQYLQADIIKIDQGKIYNI